MENVFGAAVQQYRERAGLTQVELAEALGVSQQTVAKWESGRAYPRPAAFAKLSAVLRIPQHEIAGAYGKSKGARSPLVINGGLSHRRNQADSISEGSSGAGDGFPQFVIDPYEPHMRRKLLDSVIPTLNAERPSAMWSQQIKSGTLRWTVDYMDNEVVAEFKYASSPDRLKEMLKNEARLVLWNLATLKASQKDNRHYLFIIIMPASVRVDYEEGDPEWDDLEMLTNERSLRRLNAEAASLDLSVYVANSPRQVSALFKLHSYDEHEDE